MTEPAALILDMDGVLVDTEPIHIDSFRQYIADLKINASEAFLEGLVGHSVESNIVEVNQTFLGERSVPVAEGVKRREKLYLDLLKQSDVQPMSGLEHLITVCRDFRIPLGLATSSIREQVEVILDKLTGTSQFGFDYHALFSVVMTGEDVKVKKPDKEIYKKTVDALGLLPQKCWAIEDSGAGIRSARAAGLICLALKNQYIKPEDLAKADEIIGSLTEAANKIKDHKLQR